MEEENIQEPKKIGTMFFWMIGIFIILGIVFVIMIYKDFNNYNQDYPTMSCIANKSILFVGSGCGHCAEQEKILGKYLNLFKVIDVINETQKGIDYNISYTPTWYINNKSYVGAKSQSELRIIANC